MAHEDFQQLMSAIPEATREKEDIPEPFTTLNYPDILMENDGFPTDVIYTLDSLYINLANIVGNVDRVKADGIEMYVFTNPETNKPRIELTLLLDPDISLNTSFTDSHETDTIRPTKIGFLQQNPDQWSYFNIDGDVEVVFLPVAAKPMERITENPRAGHTLIAYGSPQTRDVVQYAAGKQGRKSDPIERNNLLSDETIKSALKETAREVTKKLTALNDEGKLS